MAHVSRSPIHRFVFGRPDTATHIATWSGTELVGRILLAAIFILSGVMKFADFEGSVAHLQAQGLPAAGALLAIAAVVEIVGGLFIMTGFMTRIGALMLFLFLIPTTLIFHDFWSMSGQERISQSAQFMKNLAIMGGLLVLMAHGAGRYALDRLHHRPEGDPPRRFDTTRR